MKKFIIVIMALFYSFLGVQMLFADTTPKPFKFTDKTKAALNTVYTSNTIKVSGIDTATDISIAGGTYKINSGLYTSAPGTVNNNDTVTVQQTSSGSFSTTMIATLTIGGVSDTFGVKTLAADPKPDKFTFISQTDVALDQVITSNTITVSGINEIVPISIVGGTYSVKGGSYTSASGTVNNNDTVTVQQTSAGDYNKKTIATLTIGKGKGAFSVTTLTLTQADLTGTWRFNVLRTGSNNKWMRALISVDSSGVATCSEMYDSGGGSTCPSPFDLKLTMNPTTGVITQSGANAANTGNHMTMTSNKNFMAGTSTTGKSPNYSYQLAIMQRVVGETTYSAADVQSKSFVYHLLSVGTSNGWEYGVGATAAAGEVIISSETDVFKGTTTPGDTGAAMSVDEYGVVTMSAGGGMDNFHGFLSDDKKTIVGTVTETGKTNYRLMIFQFTGQTYTADKLFGTCYAHMLNTVPSWIHFTATVASDGVINFSHWVSSHAGSSGPSSTRTFTISSSGAVTIVEAEESTFHGQMSDDGRFMVTTQTLTGDGTYGLSVYTR